MNDKYDAVVVGAGCAGTVFSASLASRGFRVLLIDRKREEELGIDSLDILGSEAFEFSGVELPTQPEAHSPVRRMDVVSPDAATRFHLSRFPYQVVDRRLLARRLFQRAVNAGVEVKTQCIVAGAEIDKGFVVSIQTDRGNFPCRLAVGASGLDRVLCRDIPSGMGIPRRLRTADYLSIYSETREMTAVASGDNLEPGLFEYYIGRYGGYSWVYPGEDGTVDIGTGVQDAPGAPDPREIVLGYVRSNPSIGEKVVRSAGGRIPTRRPLNTMVASGFLVIGDAACQSTPLISRGIGGAMAGASLAADAAAFALEADDVSIRGLWSYNYRYMLERGAHMAALDSLRVFLQRIPEDEFSWSMSKGLIGNNELSSALMGRFETPTTQSRMKSIVKGLRSVPLTVRFENVLKHTHKVLSLYSQYPGEYDPPEYDEWSREAEYLFEDAEKL